MTRARVTQVLKLLELAPEVLDFIVALGNPLPRPVISERMLRPVLNLPAKGAALRSEGYSRDPCQCSLAVTRWQSRALELTDVADVRSQADLSSKLLPESLRQDTERAG